MVQGHTRHIVVHLLMASSLNSLVAVNDAAGQYKFAATESSSYFPANIVDLAIKLVLVCYCYISVVCLQFTYM